MEGLLLITAVALPIVGGILVQNLVGACQAPRFGQGEAPPCASPNAAFEPVLQRMKP